jgi:hypothetical protein
MKFSLAKVEWARASDLVDKTFARLYNIGVINGTH